MPRPNKFKSEKEWMSACMHQILHLEKKDRDQAIAQCLNMWRKRKKKAMKIVNNYIRGASDSMENIKKKEAAHRVLSTFLEKEGIYGEPLSPGETKIVERGLRKKEKTKSQKAVPLKVGDKIFEFINGKFEKITVTEKYLEERREKLEKGKDTGTTHTIKPEVGEPITIIA